MDYNDVSLTILFESIKFRTNPRIVKNVNMRFMNIVLCYQFSLEAVLQAMAKNNPIEKQIEAKILKWH